MCVCVTGAVCWIHTTVTDSPTDWQVLCESTDRLNKRKANVRICNGGEQQSCSSEEQNTPSSASLIRAKSCMETWRRCVGCWRVWDRSIEGPYVTPEEEKVERQPHASGEQTFHSLFFYGHMAAEVRLWQVWLIDATCVFINKFLRPFWIITCENINVNVHIGKKKKKGLDVRWHQLKKSSELANV